MAKEMWLNYDIWSFKGIVLPESPHSFPVESLFLSHWSNPTLLPSHGNPIQEKTCHVKISSCTLDCELDAALWKKNCEGLMFCCH